MDQVISLPQIAAMHIHDSHPVVHVLLVVVYTLTTLSVVIFLVQFYRYKVRKNHSDFANYPLNSKRFRIMLLMVGLWFIFMLLQTWYVTYFNIGTSENQSAIEQLLRDTPIWTWVDAVLVAPVIEELIFRGLFFEFFFTKNSRLVRTIGVVVNGALFGGLHDLGASFPIYAIMGMLLAITYLWTKDIKYSITLHIINNFISFL